MNVWLCVVFSYFFLSVQAQLRPIVPFSETPTSNEGYSQTIMQLSSTKSLRHKFSSPRLMQTTPTAGDRRSSAYWAANVTTQSYSKGKWGTFYYWDVQGNLREMKGFVDIAGKNKRGLKLVFPWR